MKCNKCGYDNPDYSEYCDNCGAQLGARQDSGKSNPTWGFVKAPRWPEPDFSADTVSENDVPTEYLGESPAKQQSNDSGTPSDGFAPKDGGSNRRIPDDSFGKGGLDDSDIGDDISDNQGEQAARDEKRLHFAPLKKRSDTKRANRSDDYDDDDDDDDDIQTLDGDDNQNAGRSRLSSVQLRRLILIVGVIAAAAIIAIIIWAVLAKGGSGGGGSGTKGTNTIIVNPDDPTAYFVTVYADEGKTLVYVTSNGTRQEVAVTDRGYVKFNVFIASLMPTEPVDGAVYMATPQVFIKNDDGTETQIPMDSIALDIPALEITFDGEADVTAVDGKTTITGKITQIDAEVTVGGIVVSVNEDGTFAQEITFEEEGVHDVTVEAKLGGYQIARQTYHVTVETPAPPVVSDVIQMPWEYGDATYSQRAVHSALTHEVRGKIPEGYTLTAKCTSTNIRAISTPTVAADGTFRFTVTFDETTDGDFVINLTATAPDGTESTRDVHIQRQPDYQTYVAGAAQGGTYAEMSTDSGRWFRISGTITEIVSTGECIIAKLQLADGNILVLHYYNHYGSAHAVEVGQTYTSIYGRPRGLDENGDPWVFVWFWDN